MSLAAPAPSASSSAAAARPQAGAHPLLDAPPLRAIARLAGPTTLVMFVQAGVSIAETAFVGRLGTEALAGFALVFPLVMVMTMMSAGGIGGGIAAAVARATGAGRRDEAAALAVHALAIAAGFAALFTALLLVFGPAIYRALGGRDATLAHALAYSNTLFAGAAAGWAMFALSAVMRGAGDAATPGKFMLLGSLLQIPLSGLLVLGTAGLGLGGWGGMGVAGAGLAWIATATLASALMARRIWGGALGFVPRLEGGFSRDRFAAILRVGLIASMGAILANLTTIVVTALVGLLGIAAIAGYGVGARLEFILVPLSFGVGSALTTLVGVAAGAGRWDRAREVAWTGAAIAAAMTGTVGALAAVFPQAWVGLFSADPAVQAAGVDYLTRVAPFYFAFGLGMALNFAAQGAGRMRVPLASSVVRVVLVAGGGWLAVRVFGGGLPELFWIVAAGLVTYGAIIAASLWLRPWGARPLAAPAGAPPRPA